MRKHLLLIGVIISMVFQASASKNDVSMTIYKKGHVEKNTSPHRSPMSLPIDVYYYYETHQIEVVGDEELVGQVFLCDEYGNTLDYSPCINAVLNIPSYYRGLILIRIEGEDWIATGKIAV